ncbi:MAG: phenylacetate-CoA oxygenase subunit PaaC [Schleiferiaceae bacterium]|nr:phenylacetate-CoA oxygenase subunit PaaC [Schleiferiaceae bacterium]
MKWDTCDPKTDYVLHLADDALILGQRLAEWCGHGPILEQDIALTNISLDLIGLARQYYQYAAELIGDGCTENDLAYHRDSRAFKNHLISEQPNGHWGDTLARQFYFDTFHFYQLEGLAQSSDERLRQIAAKAIKETSYHAQYSAEWIIRLGDGTEESHEKIDKSLKKLAPFAHEFFIESEVDTAAQALGVGPKVSDLCEIWTEKVNSILKMATLEPVDLGFPKKGGKAGLHSEHHGYLLAEMQSLARAHPGVTW